MSPACGAFLGGKGSAADGNPQQFRKSLLNKPQGDEEAGCCRGTAARLCPDGVTELGRFRGPLRSSWFIADSQTHRTDESVLTVPRNEGARCLFAHPPCSCAQGLAHPGTAGLWHDPLWRGDACAFRVSAASFASVHHASETSLLTVVTAKLSPDVFSVPWGQIALVEKPLPE